MKKSLSLVLAIAMMFTMLFAVPASAAELTELNTYEVIANEVEYWNIHLSQGARDLNVLTNCFDGLLTNDAKGNLVGNAAKEWSSEDGGKTWKFILNEGMTWVDYTGANVKAEVVAEDWRTSAEWILNAAKNPGAANASMLMEMVAGASEYYNYTKELAASDEAAALALTTADKFAEMVKITAPDKLTLVYECTDKLAYFPTLATYNCLYPVSADLIAEIGQDGYTAVTYDTLWYSGPYTVTSFIHGNEKVLTPNPNYWNKDVKLFDAVTIKMVDSALVAQQLFETGELDHVNLEASTLATIHSSESNEWHDYLIEKRPTKYAYGWHFVYNKNLEDGTPDVAWNTAIANLNFRKTLYYGLDMTSYLGRINSINPLSCQNYCYTANAVSTTSDGTDYTALVREKLGLEYDYTTYTRYNPEKAAEYKAAAIKDLTDAGIELPIKMVVYYPGSNQAQKDTWDTVKQMMADCLGEDLVVLDPKTYVSDLTNEVRKPRLTSFFTTGWGADFGDPINFLGQETYDEPNAYFSNNYSNINDATDEQLIETYKEFTRLTNIAKAITDDQDARLAAFAEAEAYFIDNVLVLPTYYDISWQLTSVNDYTKPYAAYGIQAYRYVDLETNADVYTTADYDAIKAEYNAK